MLEDSPYEAPRAELGPPSPSRAKHLALFLISMALALLFAGALVLEAVSTPALSK